MRRLIDRLRGNSEEGSAAGLQRDRAVLEADEKVLGAVLEDAMGVEVSFSDDLVEERKAGDRVLHLLQLGEERLAFEAGWELGTKADTRKNVAKMAVERGFASFVHILLDEEARLVSYLERKPALDAHLDEVGRQHGLPPMPRRGGGPADREVMLGTLERLMSFIKESGCWSEEADQEMTRLLERADQLRT
jgi:hypothetical protein